MIYFNFYIFVLCRFVSLCFRSAFFVFCNEERPKVRAAHPGYTVGDVAKELGKRWEAVSDRSKYEKLAAEDKKRYEAVSLKCF